MRFAKGWVVTVTAVLSTLFSMGGEVSAAEAIDLLRAVPLDIQGYPEAQHFPTQFQTAESVLNIINSTPILLVHMETLRRSYADLGPTERNKVLTALQNQHKKNEKDLLIGFDYGYAQLVYNRTKTGLFFLRKANDSFKSQFSSLAYGMAEAEADLLLENAAPEQMTTRKLDTIYQLSDAVQRDAAGHQPGFWPSFTRVIDTLKPLPAYDRFVKRDFSLAYVPYGPRVVPLKTGTEAQTLPLQDTASPAVLKNSLTTACDPRTALEDEEVAALASGAPDSPTITDLATSSSFKASATKSSASAGTPIARKMAIFNGTSALIQFFQTEEPGRMRVRVFDQGGSPMLSFTSYAKPTSIVEDLDGDGTLEIVARQYAENPLEPVRVYRYTPCGFELDRKVFDFFR